MIDNLLLTSIVPPFLSFSFFITLHFLAHPIADLNPETSLVDAMSFIRFKLAKALDESVKAARGDNFFSRYFTFDFAIQYNCPLCFDGGAVYETVFGIEVPVPSTQHPSALLTSFELTLKEYLKPEKGPPHVCETSATNLSGNCPGPGSQRFALGNVPQVLSITLQRVDGTGVNRNFLDPLGNNIFLPFAAVRRGPDGTVLAMGTVLHEEEYKLKSTIEYNGMTATSGNYSTASEANDGRTWIYTKDEYRMKHLNGGVNHSPFDTVYCMYERVAKESTQDDHEEMLFDSKRETTCSPDKQYLTEKALHVFSATFKGTCFLSLRDLKNLIAVTKDPAERAAIGVAAGWALQRNFQTTLRGLGFSSPLDSLMRILASANPKGFRRVVDLPGVQSPSATSVTVPNESRLIAAISGGLSAQVYYGDTFDYTNGPPDLDLFMSIEDPRALADVFGQLVDERFSFYFDYGVS